MMAAANNATFIAELEAMQAVNAGVLRRVFARLQARVAAEVCAAAGLPCREGVECPRTHQPRVERPECPAPAAARR